MELVLPDTGIVHYIAPICVDTDPGFHLSVQYSISTF